MFIISFNFVKFSKAEYTVFFHTPIKVVAFEV